MPAPDYSTEIAVLESALASGELKVESDGEMVWYRSSSEIIAQIAYFRTKAAAAFGQQTRGSSVTVFSKE